MADHILKLMDKALVDQAGKSTVENCLMVIVVSLAMVRAYCHSALITCSVIETDCTVSQVISVLWCGLGTTSDSYEQLLTF